MFERIRKFFKKPAARATSVRASLLDTEVKAAPTNFNFLVSLYLRSDWVYTGVSYLVSACVTVPFEIKKRRANEIIKPEECWLGRLLTRPNPFETQQEFFEKIFLFLELTGNVFIEKAFSTVGGYKIPRELYVINPSKVKIIPDTEKYVKGYMVQTSESEFGQSIFFEPDELIHVKYPNPSNEYWGLSPLMAVLNKLEIDFNVTEYISSFFQNDAVPGGIFSTDRILSDAVRKRLTRDLKKKHQGKKKAFNFALLEGGLKYEKIGSNFSEVQYQDLGNSLRDHVLSAMGIPPSLVGVNTNYATARVQQSLFYDSVIYPRLKRVAAAIDSQVFYKYAPEFKFTFDISTTPINVIKLSASSRVISRLYTLGILNQNEARALVGLPPVEGGDEIYYPKRVSPESQLAGKPTTGEKEEG